MNNRDQATSIVSHASDVIKIESLSNNLWCRKPNDARRGPWLSGKFRFVDEKLWEETSPCIYFVRNATKEIKYVGISLNRLKDRWRLSPAYDTDLNPLNRKELFHSQCWPRICSDHRSGLSNKYTISVIHENDLDNLESDEAIKMGDSLSEKESWLIKNLGGQLWNKKK